MDRREPYTMSLNKLIALWDLGSNIAVSEVQLEGEEIKDNVWRVRASSGEYFLKRFADYKKLSLQHQIILSLANEGVPVAVPLPNYQGEYITSFLGDHYGLYLKLAGETKKGSLFDTGGERKAELFGEAIGILHKGLAKVRNLSELKESSLINTTFSWAAPKMRSELTGDFRNLVEEVLGILHEDFAPLHPMLPKQIIHRDPHPGNFLFDADKLTGFIDFELSEINIRIFDPCYLATGLLMEALRDAKKQDQWVRLFHSIINGYEKNCPLNRDERKALWSVLVCIELVFVAFWYEQSQMKLAEDNLVAIRFLKLNRSKLHG